MLVLVGTVYLFIKIPKGFIPDQDTDQLSVITEAAQGTSYYQMVQYQSQVAEIVRAQPQCGSVHVVGGRHCLQHAGRAQLRPVGGAPEAARPAQGAGREHHRGPAAASCDNLPGMRVYLQNPPTVRIGGQVTKSLYQFSLQSPDKNELYATADKLERLIAAVPGVEDVTSDVAITSPQINVNIDRDKAAAMQVNAKPDRERVLRRLRAALGLHHLRRLERVQSSAGAETGVSGRSARALAAVLQSQQRQSDPAGYAGHSEHRKSARSRINHYGQLSAAPSRSTCSPAPRSATCSSRIDAIAAENVPAERRAPPWQGAAKAFQSQLGNTVGPAAGRDLRGLHRAGHSVRELHPSASRFFRDCPRPDSARW